MTLEILRRMAMVYSKLRGRIKEIGLTETEFGEKINLSKSAISQRLNGKTPWKVDEIEKSCKILGINGTDVSLYFFKN